MLITAHIEKFKPIIDCLVPVGGLAALFWGVWQYFHGKALDIFDRYCGKYNNIVTPELLPEWNAALKSWSDADLNEGNQHLERAMATYLNLVWEEFYLHDEGLIRKRAWEAWRSGIDQTIHTEFARSVLRKYRNHFSEFDHAKFGRIAAELKMEPLGPDTQQHSPLSAWWHHLRERG